MTNWICYFSPLLWARRLFSLSLSLGLGLVILMTIGQDLTLGQGSRLDDSRSLKALYFGLNEIRAKYRLVSLTPDADLEVAADYLVHMLASRSGSNVDVNRRLDMAGSLKKAGVRDRIVGEFRLVWSGDTREAVEFVDQNTKLKNIFLYQYYTRIGIKTYKLPNGSKAAVVVLSTDYLTADDFGQVVLELVNEARYDMGRPPVRWSHDAAGVAYKRAKEIGYHFSHIRPNGSQYSSILMERDIKTMFSGENIAKGQKDPIEVMETWLRSPSHRKNILDRDFNRLGVGVVVLPDGKPSWVQIFLGQY
jgi:uncharacterized protein YkwD